MFHTLNVNEMENGMIPTSKKCLLTVHYRDA